MHIWSLQYILHALSKGTCISHFWQWAGWPVVLLLSSSCDIQGLSGIVVLFLRIMSNDGALQLKRVFPVKQKTAFIKSSFCPLMSFRQGACVSKCSSSACFHCRNFLKTCACFTFNRRNSKRLRKSHPLVSLSRSFPCVPKSLLNAVCELCWLKRRESQSTLWDGWGSNLEQDDLSVQGRNATFHFITDRRGSLLLSRTWHSSRGLTNYHIWGLSLNHRFCLHFNSTIKLQAKLKWTMFDAQCSLRNWP